MYYYYPYYVYDYRQRPDLSQANLKMRSHLSAIQQIPIHSSSFQQSMGAVVKHLQAVSRALALGCGMSSEFRFLPDTWGLRELHIVHAKYLTPLSYHVYSALGATELLASGQGRAPHFPLMVGRMNSILRLWSNFPRDDSRPEKSDRSPIRVICRRGGKSPKTNGSSHTTGIIHQSICSESGYLAGFLTCRAVSSGSTSECCTINESGIFLLIKPKDFFGFT